MALDRKGLTCGVIHWLTVCCFILYCVCAFNCKHCKHTAMQSHAKQCAGADRGENCIVYIQFSPSVEMQN
ncbi:unnamed protein product, partial [Staurois parvus]